MPEVRCKVFVPNTTYNISFLIRAFLPCQVAANPSIV